MDWWQDYFDEIYLKIYLFLDNPETNKRQADFIEKALELKNGYKILDLACGQGRHAIELAKRGYNITGFDYSDYLLNIARERAKKESIKINFIKGDMRNLPFKSEFDAIYNFFTSFGYFSDEDNLKVLKEVSKSLKKGGKFLIDLSNPIRIIKYFMRKSWFKTEEGIYCIESNELDALKMVIKSERIILEDGKKIGEKTHYIRLYTPAELCFLMRISGLEPVRFYGDWKDLSDYSENSPRLIIVAVKQ